jgi:hypothetical protein
MIDSVRVGGGLVVVGEQGALVGDAELPVEANRGGQGEQPLRDPDEHPAKGAATVAFQAELVFEGVEDALDPLAHPAKRPEVGWLVGAVGTDQPSTQLTDVSVKLLAGKALVAKDDRACGQATLGGQLIRQDRCGLPLAELGVARHQLIGMPSGAQSR